jgi:hypothetical protein
MAPQPAGREAHRQRHRSLSGLDLPSRCDIWQHWRSRRGQMIFPQDCEWAGDAVDLRQFGLASTSLTAIRTTLSIGRGFDEMDEVRGSGSAELLEDSSLEIEFDYQLGDQAVLKVERAASSAAY